MNIFQLAYINLMMLKPSEFVFCYLLYNILQELVKL